ncbi:hypothetical protein QWJ26_13360 [Streptomyces sp. CSDS2]|nr:hypothetical protein [Streptomyces sp. CSDS2]MDN3260783.1 hypothetical protein [Streptomyces sp. CSDS2]
MIWRMLMPNVRSARCAAGEERAQVFEGAQPAGLLVGDDDGQPCFQVGHEIGQGQAVDLEALLQLPVTGDRIDAALGDLRQRVTELALGHCQLWH